MLHVPHDVLTRYGNMLDKRDIAANRQAECRKWLRYFFDFREKYRMPEAKPEQLRLFMEKLREKKQTDTQQKHAYLAVSIYFEMLSLEDQADESFASGTTARKSVARQGSSHYCEAGYQEKSDSPEWDAVLEALAAEIKVRHYSRKTLRTYANWSRRFQRYLKSKPPKELSTADVKNYLTYLAVQCKVAASTQNQAFYID